MTDIIRFIRASRFFWCYIHTHTPPQPPHPMIIHEIWYHRFDIGMVINIAWLMKFQFCNLNLLYKQDYFLVVIKHKDTIIFVSKCFQIKFHKGILCTFSCTLFYLWTCKCIYLNFITFSLNVHFWSMFDSISWVNKVLFAYQMSLYSKYVRQHTKGVVATISMVFVGLLEIFFFIEKH